MRIKRLRGCAVQHNNAAAANYRRLHTSVLQHVLRDIVSSYRELTANVLSQSRLAITGGVIRVPVRMITDEFAFSLAPNGWNHYCALVAEYERQRDIAIDQTTFYRFFRDQRIANVRFLDDILYLHRPERRSLENRFQFYLGTYPWGGLTQTDSLAGGSPFGWYYDHVAGAMTRDLWGYKQNLWYKPDDLFTLELEWINTINHYHALKKHYRPLLYGSLPSATLLLRRDGEIRAVMADGHHRMSILSYLGYENMIVEPIQIVKENDVEQWYYVKNGQCRREQAIEIFNAFFELNGAERASYLGLVS